MAKEPNQFSVTDAKREEVLEKMAKRPYHASAMIDGAGVRIGDRLVYITKGGKDGQVKIKSMPIARRKTG